MNIMTELKSTIQASVIIPTRNRAHYLSRTLESLSRQTMPPEAFEILVIDNGSLDSTSLVVEKVVAKLDTHCIRYIYEPVPGSLSGRHRGAVEAKSDILVFIDDDIAAASEWLNAIIGSFADATLQIVGGRNLPHYEEPPRNGWHGSGMSSKRARYVLN
jgi:glycosyltransferase involved in cell wall biosynthesis